MEYNRWTHNDKEEDMNIYTQRADQGRQQHTGEKNQDDHK